MGVRRAWGTGKGGEEGGEEERDERERKREQVSRRREDSPCHRRMLVEILRRRKSRN